MDQVVGGKYAAFLITTLSRDTSVARRSEIARALAKRHGLSRVDLYCSEEAWRSEFSACYAEQHPGAMEKCSLGVLEDGRFKPFDAPRYYR